MPTSSGMFHLNLSDVQKAIVMAIFSGFALPIAAAIQTPGFNVFTANWSAIATLAVNGAIIGFVTYISKNFLSDSTGAVFGYIGGIKTQTPQAN
jgi:hypothetical protein